MRICLISERLARPFDEGFKNVALNLIHHLARDHTVQGLTCFGEDLPEHGVTNLPANRLLLSTPLWQALREFRPDIVYYLPTAAITPASLIRGGVLRLLSGGAPIVLISLQPRPTGRLLRRVGTVFAPDLLFVASHRMLQDLPDLGCPVAIVPLGVDLDRFVPGTPQSKMELRFKHGVPVESFVILHVGHIKRERNVQLLAQLESKTGCHPVLVGSTSTAQEEDLVNELRRARVTVISDYMDIVEAYHLADGYFFPVHQDSAAIGVPLSVLEAMACNLPVVSTPFGDLPELFAPRKEAGLWFAESDEQLLAAVAEMRQRPVSDTRQRVAPYAWEAVARGMVETTLAELGAKR